ncbi:hypothetical protein [Helicobacter sp. T3_23-1056]
MAKSKSTKNETQETTSEQEALESTQEASQESNAEASQDSTSEAEGNADSSQESTKESTPNKDKGDSSQESTQESSADYLIGTTGEQAKKLNQRQDAGDISLKSTKNPTQDTTPTQNGAKKFNEILTNALDEKAQWREQIRVSLQAIQEVYIAFVALDETYQTGLKATDDALKSLANQTERVDSLATQIATAIAQAKKDFARVQEEANNALTLANATIQSTAQNAKITNDNLKATEAIWDKTREMGQTILQKEEVIITAFEKWKALDSMLLQANVLKAELDSKLEAHRSQLALDKEGYEDELEQKNQEITRGFETLSNAKITALETLSETKNTALSTRIDNLNTELESHKNRIQTASDLLATSYDKIKDEIIISLAEYVAKVRESESPIFYKNSTLTKANQQSAFLIVQYARALQKYAILHQNAKILENGKIASFLEFYEEAKVVYDAEQEEKAEQAAQASKDLAPETQERLQNEQASQESSQTQDNAESSQESTSNSSEKIPEQSTTQGVDLNHKITPFMSYDEWIYQKYNDITLATLKTHSKLFALPAEIASQTLASPLNINTSKLSEVMQVLLSDEQKADPKTQKIQYIDTLIKDYETNSATTLSKYAAN